MSEHVVKVVLIGPECTGKTTLCKQLAHHYNTIWVEEYAREYLTKNGSAYTKEDIVEMAKGQIENEENALQLLNNIQSSNYKRQTSNPKILFIDTDMLVMKVWSEIVFNGCDLFILNHISERVYDFYILCEPDFEWQQDELRESPNLQDRKKIYHHYKDILIHQHVPWISVKGDEASRLKQVVEMLDALFQ